MSQAQRHFCFLPSRSKTHLSAEPPVCGLCLGFSQTSWQIHQRVQQQPPARAATSSSNPQGGEAPSAPGKCTGGLCSLRALFTCLQLWQDVGCSRGCFMDGCGWLEVCLSTPFDPPTHLLTPSPVLTPPWSSAPSFPTQWHSIFPHSRLGYGKTIKPREVLWAVGWFGHPGARKELQPHSHPGEPIPAAEPSFKDVWAEQFVA